MGQGILLAALLSLDTTVVGQWMLSRPMVVGPLVGFSIGQPEVGFWIGLTVEFLWMDVNPIGVGIPFDVTAVAALATLWGSSVTLPMAERLGVALLLAAPFGFLFQRWDTWVRRLNTVWMHSVETGLQHGREWAVEAGVAGGVLFCGLGALGAYTFSFWLGLWILEHGVMPWIPSVQPVLVLLMRLLPMAALGVALEFFLSEPGEAWWPFYKNKDGTA